MSHASRVSDRAALIVLPHKVSVPAKGDDQTWVKRIEEMAKWIESDDTGTGGQYGISYLHDSEEIVVSFSDPNTAFHFKFRFR